VTPNGDIQTVDVVEYVNENEGVTSTEVAEWFGLTVRNAGAHLLRAYNMRKIDRLDASWPHRYVPLGWEGAC